MILSQNPRNPIHSIYSPTGLFLVTNLLLSLFAPLWAHAQKLKDQTGQRLQDTMMMTTPLTNEHPTNEQEGYRIEDVVLCDSPLRIDTSNIRTLVEDELRRKRVFEKVTWRYETSVSYAWISKNKIHNQCILYTDGTAITIDGDTPTQVSILQTPSGVLTLEKWHRTPSGMFIGLNVTDDLWCSHQKEYRRPKEWLLLSKQLGISAPIQHIATTEDADHEALRLVYAGDSVYIATFEREILKKIQVGENIDVESGKSSFVWDGKEVHVGDQEPPKTSKEPPQWKVPVSDYDEREKGMLNNRWYLIDKKGYLIMQDSFWNYINLGKMVLAHDARDNPIPDDYKVIRRGNTQKFALEWDRCVTINPYERRVQFSSYDINGIENEPALTERTQADLARRWITKMEYGRSTAFREEVADNRRALERWDTSILSKKPAVVIYAAEHDGNGSFMRPDFDFDNFTVLWRQRKNAEDIAQANGLLKKNNIKPAYRLLNGHGIKQGGIEGARGSILRCQDIAHLFGISADGSNASWDPMYGGELILNSCHAWDFTDTGTALVECLMTHPLYFEYISGLEGRSSMDIQERSFEWKARLELNPAEGWYITKKRGVNWKWK